MYNSILLPIDPESVETSAKAIASAVRVAQDYDADLHVLSVVQEPSSYASSFFPENFVEKTGEKARKSLKVVEGEIPLPPERVNIHVVSGTVYDQIIAQAKKLEIDLIVLASHRPELSDYLLGPNAARVVRHALCSVMVVR